MIGLLTRRIMWNSFNGNTNKVNETDQRWTRDPNFSLFTPSYDPSLSIAASDILIYSWHNVCFPPSPIMTWWWRMWAEDGGGEVELSLFSVILMWFVVNIVRLVYMSRSNQLQADTMWMNIYTLLLFTYMHKQALYTCINVMERAVVRWGGEWHPTCPHSLLFLTDWAASNMLKSQYDWQVSVPKLHLFYWTTHSLLNNHTTWTKLGFLYTNIVC